MRRSGIVVACLGLALSCIAGSSASGRSNEAPAIAAQGLTPVASIPYQSGTHLAFTTAKGRDYAFAVQAPYSAPNGYLRSIDITDPSHPFVADIIECGFNQGYLDISNDRRTLIMGSDATGYAGDECLGAGHMGFMTIDISNPEKLRPVGFASVDRGSHGATAHPIKPFVYNSYGDVVTADPPEFEIWSIKNPARPKFVKIVAVPGYHGPHDMTFNPNGNLMVASNVSTIQVFDTTDPKNPELLSTLQCPGCIHTHEARFTPDGKRLVLADETISFTGQHPCPGGGLYFYDVAEDGALTLTGAFQPTQAVLPEGRTSLTFCTAHVIGLSADGNEIAASWHGAGVRYIDMTHSDGFSLGDDFSTGRGPKELGWFVADDSEAMSAKFYRGPFIYSNDLNRGFEVFRTP